MGLRMTGLGEISGMLERMQLTDEDKSRILLAAAEPIEDAARHNAVGSIAESIRTRYKNGKVTVGVHRADWTQDEYYPAYVEYGHGGPHPAPAHPYIRPAFDMMAPVAESIIVSELRATIKGG